MVDDRFPEEVALGFVSWNLRQTPRIGPGR